MRTQVFNANTTIETATSVVQTPAKILFIAGDLSGDNHLARVVCEVARLKPSFELFGVGGAQMSASGATMLGDSRDCGVIGLIPALLLVPRLLELRRRVLDWCKNERPQLVVLCDWGAFNARLLPSLRALQIPVLYYFPPASWRKRGGGVSIAPLISRVATPFSWSAQRLQNAGAQAEWVGHPILESVRPLSQNSEERRKLRQEFGVRDDERLVVLMPGSRALELRSIAPHLAGVVEIMRAAMPNAGEKSANPNAETPVSVEENSASREEVPRSNLQNSASISSESQTRESRTYKSSTRFVVAVPKGVARRVRKFFPDVAIIEGRAPQLLMACDAAVVKSGTSTLEAAAADAPQVVVYDAPAVMRAQWNLMGGTKKIPFVAMPNIILERGAVPELLGHECRPRSIIAALLPLLNDENARATMRESYAEVRRALGAELENGATARTAQIVVEMLTRAPAAPLSSTRTRTP